MSLALSLAVFSLQWYCHRMGGTVHTCNLEQFWVDRLVVVRDVVQTRREHLEVGHTCSKSSGYRDYEITQMYPQKLLHKSNENGPHRQVKAYMYTVTCSSKCLSTGYYLRTQSWYPRAQAPRLNTPNPVGYLPPHTPLVHLSSLSS